MAESTFLIQFNAIYIDVQATPGGKGNAKGIKGGFIEPGKLRFATQGLGWKGNNKDVYTIPVANFRRFAWFRAARNYELNVMLKDHTIARFQGFNKEDFESVRDTIKSSYKGTLETKEFSLKGWNWGKAEFEESDLIFAVNDKSIFEFPLSKVANTNLVGKNEVSLEFLQPEDPLAKGAALSNKTGIDELVEMRFYIPNSTTANKDDETSETKEEVEDQDSRNAAVVFYETIKDRANLQVAGEAICLFAETLFITPRGRYDVDMFPTFFRLRGKTYDYKILYTNIARLFYLPKPDALHKLFVISLDPPLRQGQTRYSHLVLQWAINEELDLELNLDESDLADKYKNELKKNYSDPTSVVVSDVFRVLSGKPLTKEATSYSSNHGASAFKCSLKANEGNLYPLEKMFLFVPKPPMEIPHSEIGSISFSRIGAGSVASSRTFDLKFNLKGGTSHQFSSINKEELKNIERYLRAKDIRFKDEKAEQAAQYSELEVSSEDEGDRKRLREDDEDPDDESPDEDFVAESESEVGEEFDEDYSEEEKDEE
ncbi:FACT complex subunit [Entomophthora muscae]|uniref:FACT complex subunit n=1 Tax=Entomophthora muscae TaxID=34485 RepID=A0ACC2TQS3_9FUNG|nr:FACT complex subunit [Entomophthora muscae]